jgi:hypothetical protein
MRLSRAQFEALFEDLDWRRVVAQRVLPPAAAGWLTGLVWGLFYWAFRLGSEDQPGAKLSSARCHSSVCPPSQTPHQSRTSTTIPIAQKQPAGSFNTAPMRSLTAHVRSHRCPPHLTEPSRIQGNFRLTHYYNGISVNKPGSSLPLAW